MAKYSVFGFFNPSTFSTPQPLVKDVDLLDLIRHLLILRGEGDVSMVKEHPDDHQVASGTVRWEDKVGDDQADNAADRRRRDQQAGVISTCRKLVSGSEYWYSWVWLLHRFMNAISRAALDEGDGGGNAPSVT